MPSDGLTSPWFMFFNLQWILLKITYYKMSFTKWFGKVEVDIGRCYCRDKEHLMERIKEICPKLPILKLHPLNGTLVTLPLAKLSLRRERDSRSNIGERGLDTAHVVRSKSNFNQFAQNQDLKKGFSSCFGGIQIQEIPLWLNSRA